MNTILLANKTRVATGLLGAGAAACLLAPVGPAGGLLAGAALAWIVGNPVSQITGRWAGRCLKAAVVALGAGMNLAVVWRTGTDGFVTTLAGLACTLALGLWLGRRAGLSRDLSLLLASGTAICGGSAVAAVSGVIRPRAHDASVALAVVFLLNAVALLVFPALGHRFGFTQEQFGLWAALAIHDTSSVVGAASVYGAAALSVAVTVKLARALWIVPVTAGVGWLRARETDGVGGGAGLAMRRLLPPGFIVGYVLVAALFTYAPALQPWAKSLGTGAHRLMTVALFLIGAGLSREALRSVGWRPLAVAAALWAVVATGSAAAVKLGWLAV